MKAVRTAIIGLGYWGPNVLRNFNTQPLCEMALGCDLEQKNIDRMRALYPALTYTQNPEDIFRDASIELVLIATPTSTHLELASRALAAGKHVFVEKPMTATLDEARTLEALAKSSGKHVFVDHTFVFAPAVRKMAEFAHTGKLGTLLYFDSVRINLGLIQKDINVLWDLAVHDLSILSTLLPLSSLTMIAAYGSRHFGLQEEDAHLHLRFQSGFEAHIHSSWLSPVKIRKTILAGTTAMVTFDDLEPSEKIRLYDSGIDHDDTRTDPFFPKYRAGDVLIPAISNTETLALEAEHVLLCVQGKEEPRVSAVTGRQIVEILTLANESLRSKKQLEVAGV